MNDLEVLESTNVEIVGRGKRNNWLPPTKVSEN